MAGILDSVNQRTQLVGQNRLELLLFRLQGKQVYGINVFKVKEVLQCPKLTLIPQRHPVIRGLAHIRGGTIPIMDMGLAIGQRPIHEQDIYNSFVIITEYNRKTQGFLVGGVERIVNLNWEEIHPPPKGAGKENYLTAVTEIDKKLTEIIDVEKILAEVAPIEENLDKSFIEQASEKTASSENKTVLVVDDSVVARKQIQNCLQTIGLNVVTQKDGLQAYNYLGGMLDEGKDPGKEIALMISDVEMPEMDGYTLTAKCKSDPRFDGLYIMLHTSLSGVFNKAMVQKVGADDFMAKFSPDELAERVMEIIDSRSSVAG